MDENKNFAVTMRQAVGFWERFAGFMLKKSARYALLFENCASIHTFFMRFNIDVVYLDKDKRIVAIKRNVKPWRVLLPVKSAVSIAEIPSYLNLQEKEIETLLQLTNNN